MRKRLNQFALCYLAFFPVVLRFDSLFGVPSAAAITNLIQLA